MKKIWEKIKGFFKWLFSQIKDVRTFIIFVIVVVVMSSEIWVPYLLAIITGDAWWWGIGSACWAFWIGPFTPFFPLCVAITLGIKKIIEVITGKKEKKKGSETTDADNTGEGAEPDETNLNDKSDLSDGIKKPVKNEKEDADGSAEETDN